MSYDGSISPAARTRLHLFGKTGCANGDCRHFQAAISRASRPCPFLQSYSPPPLRLLNVLPSAARSVYSTTIMAHAHGSTSTDSSGTVMSMMIPWLHFSSGDNLFFASWAPNSTGALVGASIGLIFLALFERWVAAIRGVMEAHWKRQ